MATCRPSTSASQSGPLTVPTFNLSSVNDENVTKRKLPSIFLTPTLQTRSPSVNVRKVKSATKYPGLESTLTQATSTAPKASRRFSPSPSQVKTLYAQDRLIPSRSLTDLELASHLLSPLSFNKWVGPLSETHGNDEGHAAEEDDRHKDCEADNEQRSSSRILHFSQSGGSNRHGRFDATQGKPLTLITRPKLKIPTKPDRIMAAPGTFLQYGFQSANWAPSSMLVVALESGVYICKVNEDCNDVLEIKSNSKDPENPFYHVLWNMEGNSVVCAKLTGEVQMCDLKHQTCRIQWQMETKQFLKSVALERDCLLTCGTEGHGVSIYDVRLNGAERIQPIWRLRTKKDPRMSVNSLSWSPNGHTLACGSQSGLIHLWDIRQPAKEMRVHDAQKGNPVQVLNWCQWKPSILVSGSGYPRPSICLYNTATGMVQCQMECASEVTGIQFNPHLRQIATSHNTNAHLPPFYTPRTDTRYGADSSVELWKHHRNKLIPQLTLGQHENGIISMAVSPDHNNLLSMGGDELLCLWQWCDINAKSSASALGHLEARSQLEFSNLIR